MISWIMICFLHIIKSESRRKYKKSDSFYRLENNHLKILASIKQLFGDAEVNAQYIRPPASGVRKMGQRPSLKAQF